MNINTLVKSFYNKKTENEDLVNEVLSLLVGQTQMEMLQEARKGIALSYDGIPDIPIAEIPWSTITTKEGGADIPAPQRKQLMDFLSQIEGDDLPAKVQSLSRFYETDPNQLLKEGFFGKTAKQKISKALSYLTFYKTLTKIIAHFNAASAGFSFESFLGVLLGGIQIPTGQQTIADLMAIIDGEKVPISLKLYTEKDLKVGGSFTDLVGDLVKYEKMQYVAVTKLLNKEATAGTLDFYRFDFTLDNVALLLSNAPARSTGPNPHLMRLPSVFVRNPEAFEDIQLPEAPKEEELAELFDNRVRATAAKNDIPEEIVVKGLEVIGFPDSEAYLGTGTKKFAHPRSQIRSSAKPFIAGLGLLKTSTRPHKYSDPHAHQEWNEMLALSKNLYSIMRGVYSEVVETASRAVRARRDLAAKAGGSYLSTADSLVAYTALSPELKKRALLVSWGFINTERFELIQSEVQNIERLAPSALPAGQKSSAIGTLEVGEERITKLLESISAIIDESVFAIFEDLKALTTNIQSYFANGLQDDSEADVAITASESIGEKTEELKDEN